MDSMHDGLPVSTSVPEEADGEERALLLAGAFMVVSS